MLQCSVAMPAIQGEHEIAQEFTGAIVGFPAEHVYEHRKESRADIGCVIEIFVAVFIFTFRHVRVLLGDNVNLLELDRDFVVLRIVYPS